MKKKNGFTLIELGVVLSAISVLAASTMTYNGFRQAAVHTQVRKALKDIRTGTAASLILISAEDAGDQIWLQYLADKDFIATDDNYEISFTGGIKIIQAHVQTQENQSAYMKIYATGINDTAAADLLNAESTISSYYADAPKNTFCNQNNAHGLSLFVICYKL
ncbi:MAG: type II secretion system protein [Myxococcota bacterium]|nr:type II secretion system protein [Myxococcota bacterium]